ncbi:MAG TPA: tetratricopeptide repeat-containing glycosyltransferase family protein [Tepidisphaeraceae bacterium]|jgi:Flp pilus assembly protein TadD|nr:tetratricopeptide repeat-containing glycosyltransferase family protein [Tepidisphaeraceae bacterium]
MTEDSASQSMQLAAERLAAKRPLEAADICRQSLTRFPDDAKLHYLLAFALAEAQQSDAAIDAYHQAIRLKPDFFQAYTNLGTLLSKQGRLDDAIQALSQAVRLQPEMAEMHVNLSNALRQSWKLDEAAAVANRAIALNPDLAEAHQSVGAALQSLGKFEEAIRASHDAIRLKPELAGAHLNVALAELVLGNLDRGWPEYEWRHKRSDILPQRSFPQPRWDGSRIDGKTILLYCEQGFGDAIHFIRYAPLVAGLGGRVILECPIPLLRLFRGYRGIERIVPVGEPLPNFDVQCALPSLPGLFGTTLQSIPAPIPYLTASAAMVESWRDRMKPSPDVRQIGLAWAGRPDNRNDRNRSIGLERFSPLGHQPGIHFHSLLPIRAANSPFPMSDWSDLLKDFAETAALLANLDLIISVDTAVAHLAGAMGKPVWLLLPFPPDWRWMLDRPDSPWYPTMKLFRQQTRGDWDGVIGRVAEKLKNAFLATDENQMHTDKKARI